MTVLIRRIAAVAALIAALLAPGATAQDAEQCLDPAVCPIPYVRLAKQETEPFRFQGDVVDANHPWAYDYGAAIRQFPDVWSCLIEEERDSPLPDLRQINWTVIDNIREIEVCVFRIASSIDDVEAVQQWLQYHRFEKISARPMYHSRYVPASEYDPVFYLEYRLSIYQFRNIFKRSWLSEIVGYEIGRSYDIYVYFSERETVFGVFSDLNTKWNE